MILILQGPRGSGKTTLAKAICTISDTPIYYVRSTLQLPQDHHHLYAESLLILDNVEALTDDDIKLLESAKANVVVTTTSMEKYPFLSYKLSQWS